MTTILKRYHFVIAQEFSAVLDVDHERADPILTQCFEQTPFDIAINMLAQFKDQNQVVLARMVQRLVHFGPFSHIFMSDTSVPDPMEFAKNGIYVIRFDRMDIAALDIELVHEGDAPLPEHDVCRPFIPDFLQRGRES